MNIHPSITRDKVILACERQMFGLDNPGFCTACGAEADGCEPDAEEYECECCGEAAVYGAQQLAFMLIA